MKKSVPNREEKVAEIITLYVQGLSLHEIALQCSLSASTVARWIDESGFKREVRRRHVRPQTGKTLTFTNHPAVCHSLYCKNPLVDPVKSGFHPGGHGQWKAFCEKHGYIYYDLE